MKRGMKGSTHRLDDHLTLAGVEVGSNLCTQNERKGTSVVSFRAQRESGEWRSEHRRRVGALICQ